MPEILRIKSRLKDYSVNFTDDFEKTMEGKHSEETSFFIIDFLLGTFRSGSKCLAAFR